MSEMEINMTLLGEYSVLYPDQNDSIQKLIEGIPKDILIKCATSFLAYQTIDNFSPFWKDILDVWYNNDTDSRKLEFIKRINNYYGKEANNVNLIEVNSSLRLLQLGLSETNDDKIKSEFQVPIDLLKLYLLLNEEFTSLHTQSTEYIETKYPTIKTGMFLLTIGFSISDITHFLFPKEWMCQSIKFYLFALFIKTTSNFTKHREIFLNKYSVASLEEYNINIVVFLMPIAQKKGGSIELNVPVHLLKFVEALSIFEYIEEDDIDFRVIRSTPLIRMRQNVFRVTHPLFIVDKIYKSIYFEFNKINAELHGNDKIKSFRGDYTSLFSEQFLLYNLMEYITKKEFLEFNGTTLDHMGIDGSPDYYIRDGSNIFLIENKDVLIKADAKEKPIFELIEKELKEKFLKEKNGRDVGVGQILNNVMRVLTMSNEFDNSYNLEEITIYPILVVHDIVYDCPGLNALLDYWFQAGLKILESQGLDIKCVKPLLVLNIDTLIISAEVVRLRTVSLSEIFDVYYDRDKNGPHEFLPSLTIIKEWLDTNHKEHSIPMSFLIHLNDLLKG